MNSFIHLPKSFFSKNKRWTSFHGLTPSSWQPLHAVILFFFLQENCTPYWNWKLLLQVWESKLKKVSFDCRKSNPTFEQSLRPQVHKSLWVKNTGLLLLTFFFLWCKIKGCLLLVGCIMIYSNYKYKGFLNFYIYIKGFKNKTTIISF